MIFTKITLKSIGIYTFFVLLVSRVDFSKILNLLIKIIILDFHQNNFFILSTYTHAHTHTHIYIIEWIRLSGESSIKNLELQILRGLFEK